MRLPWFVQQHAWNCPREACVSLWRLTGYAGGRRMGRALTRTLCCTHNPVESNLENRQERMS